VLYDILGRSGLGGFLTSRFSFVVLVCGMQILEVWVSCLGLLIPVVHFFLLALDRTAGRSVVPTVP
jgi:hypothetical protein